MYLLSIKVSIKMETVVQPKKWEFNPLNTDLKRAAAGGRCLHDLV